MGIDLGTTNSVVAVVGDDGRPHILEHKGERIIPSVVAVTAGGELLVGEEARNYLLVDPDNAVRSVKRSMGSDRRFTLQGKSYSPQQISALILRKMRTVAEAALGEPVRRAVITVPAYFTDQQRIATKEAGELAGLEVVRIINEPTAAALAYSAGRDIGQKVLVYDLGGGTFDVSLVQIDGSMVEVLATAGNNHLGGDDFDQRLVDQVVDNFRRRHQIDLRADSHDQSSRLVLAKLLMTAEEVKKRLSDFPVASFHQPFIITKDGTPYHIEEEIARHRFEEVIGDLIKETLTCVDQVLRDAKCRPRQIDKILLVGGSTRIPYVRKRLTEHLYQEPFGEINPDECVALGAAVQAAIIDERKVDAILVDVTAHSLGIATAAIVAPGRVVDDVYSVIIPRNTVIPTEKAEMYETLHDNQKAVEIPVYQGEEPVASQNELLGEFTLEGLPLRPAGEVKIQVNFAMDVNGILQVTARELTTGKAAEITVRDMRRKMDSYKKAEEEAAISSFWGDEMVEVMEEMDEMAKTKALLERARELLAHVSGEKADEVQSLIAEIDAILKEDEPDLESLGDLEDELLDMLEEIDEDEGEDSQQRK